MLALLRVSVAFALPVYLLNNSPDLIGSIEPAVFPAAVSHFLGDGEASLSDTNEEVFDLISSRFMDSRRSAVLLVHNFDNSLAESVLGSSPASVDVESQTWLAEHGSWVSPAALDMDDMDGKIVKINAIKNGVDYNQQLMEFLRDSKDRLIAVGVPTNTKLAKRQVSKAANTSLPFYESEESCLASTNSCSQHGKCVLGSNKMYACRCESTKEGDYTYYWGGNDCSKRDVSFQFSLIVGTTLAVVVASALAVKLLFNLGSEPLPGVLTTTPM